jgi:hypothetical protein
MPRIIPRAEIGLPARVTSFNHITLRPLLRTALGTIACHYTGVERTYAGLTQEQVHGTIKSINRWKPNEYNYVIDLAGRVYEFAGEHRAAHATGFNDTAYGVLFLNGIHDAMTSEQLASFHFLFGALLWTGRVQADPFVLGHFELVGANGRRAATACPGPIKEWLQCMRKYDANWHAQAA